VKRIYKASDITEAHIVTGLLSSRGIEAHVGGFYLQGGVGDLAAMDFANVHVADYDFEKARIIISEYESTQIQTPKKSRVKKATVTSRVILAILALLFIIFVFIIIIQL
jgi:hypothetical protein